MERGQELIVRLDARAAVDLELWDVAHEATLFRQVFARRLRVELER